MASMKKFLPFLAILSLGFASCAGPKANYKTNYAPPSTVGTKTSISGGQANVTSAQARAKEQGERIARSSTHVKAAAAKAKTAKERLVVLEKATTKEPEVHALVLQITDDVDALTQELLGANMENDALSSVNSSLIIDLGKAQDQLRAAQVQLDAATKAINAQTQTLNATSKTLNEQIVQGATDKRNAHKFKFIIIGTVVFALGAVMFGIFGVASFLPPLLYVTLGAPAAVGVFLYFWLGSS
jgi:chromosome segregation ATPase